MGIINYKKIEKYYGYKLKELLPDFLLLTKKWQNSDLFYPFSDLDFRLILKKNKNMDFFKINKIIYKIHFDSVNKHRHGSRILEHPPGFIFFKEEFDIKNNYSNFDVNKWSYSYGDKKFFYKLKKEILELEFLADDIKSVFKRLNNFTLNFEYKGFNLEQQKIYEYYCLIWHYYLPCIHALNSFTEKRNYNNKINFSWYKNANLKKAIKLKNLNHLMKKYSFYELKKIIDNELNIDFKKYNIKHKVIMKINYDKAIAMLRIRPARIQYFLNPPFNVNTDYLIDREIIELKQIFNVLINKSNIIKNLYFTLCYSRHENKKKLKEVYKIMLKEKKFFNNLMK